MPAFPVIQQWVSWLWENLEVIAFLSYLWYHRKYVYKTFIFTPLAGGNGKIQMDELAKGLIIAICIWSINKDANRTHEWAYFSDAYYLSLFGAFFAIASIKPIASAISTKQVIIKKEEETTTEPEGHGQV